jgi:hypothetical protein
MSIIPTTQEDTNRRAMVQVNPGIKQEPISKIPMLKGLEE